MRTFITLFLGTTLCAIASHASPCVIKTSALETKEPSWNTDDATWIATYEVTKGPNTSPFVTHDLEQARSVARHSIGLGVCDSLVELPYTDTCKYALITINASSGHNFFPRVGLRINDKANYFRHVEWPIDFASYARELEESGFIAKVRDLNLCSQISIERYECSALPTAITGVADGFVEGEYRVVTDKEHWIDFPSRSEAQAFLTDPFCASGDFLHLDPHSVAVTAHGSSGRFRGGSLALTWYNEKRSDSYATYFESLKDLKEVLNALSASHLVAADELQEALCQLAVEGDDGRKVRIYAGKHRLYSESYYYANDLSPFLVARELILNGFCAAFVQQQPLLRALSFNEDKTVKVQSSLPYKHSDVLVTSDFTIPIDQLLLLKEVGITTPLSGQACDLKVLYSGAFVQLVLNNTYLVQSKEMSVISDYVEYFKLLMNPTQCTVS